MHYKVTFSVNKSQSFGIFFFWTQCFLEFPFPGAKPRITYSIFWFLNGAWKWHFINVWGVQGNVVEMVIGVNNICLCLTMFMLLILVKLNFYFLMNSESQVILYNDRWICTWLFIDCFFICLNYVGIRNSV